MARYRYIFILSTTCIVLSNPALASQAPITKVVVYGDRAQVTRTQQAVSCDRGKATFSGLPSTLEVKTLWGALLGGAGEVLGVTHAEEASGPRPEAKALQDKIRQIDVQLTEASGDIETAAVAQRKLDSFKDHMHRVWSDQSRGKSPPVRSWDESLDLLRREALQAKRRQRLALTKQRALQRERQELIQKLHLIERKRRRTTLSVHVLLRCKGQRKVHLSYVVPGASWEMGYQLRADTSGRKVTLVAQAAVHQGTGEDWQNVSLAVSTANLQRTNTPPKIRPLQVGAHEPQDTRKVLSRRLEHRVHLEAAGAKKAAPAAPDTGLAMEVTAARKVTVPGDGRRVVVVLESKKAKADVVLETVPKLYPYVYTKLSTRNPFGFTMLAGRVQLYRAGEYLGQARLKLLAPNEPMSVSMGVNNQIQVHRFVKQEKHEMPGALGSKQQLRHRYVIQLGNWSSTSQRIQVQENIPVSQVEDITVDLSQDTTKPDRYNKTDGMLSWTLRVPPRNKKKLTLDYTVTLPKSYVVRGY